MTSMLFWGLVGAFIGWNLPQPPWAVWLQAKIVELYNKAKNKVSGGE